MEEKDQYEHARQNALGSLASIREMVARLEHADECNGDPDDCELVNPEGTPSIWRPLTTGESFDDYHDADAARQAIEEDALSVQVRSGWYSPGAEHEVEEFEILLTTGGPALRIVGDLDQYGQPECPRLEIQDWFIPWQEVALDSEDYAALRAYCAVFYFGDGS